MEQIIEVKILDIARLQVLTCFGQMRNFNFTKQNFWDLGLSYIMKTQIQRQALSPTFPLSLNSINNVPDHFY